MKLFEIDGNKFDWTAKEEWEGNIIKLKYNENTISYAYQMNSVVTLFISLTDISNPDINKIIQKVTIFIDNLIEGKEEKKKEKTINKQEKLEKLTIDTLLKLKEKFSVSEIINMKNIGLI